MVELRADGIMAQVFRQRFKQNQPQPSTGKRVASHLHLYDPLRHVEAARRPHTLMIEPIIEDTASPDINWTNRVGNECYLPMLGESPANSAYSMYSFDIGPTLAMGMDALVGPDKFMDLVVEADQISVQLQAGHGNAMAQGFHHTISCLSRNSLDRMLQIQWGIDHFQNRFGRPTEGFWLPEAAVDLDSLADLEARGVKYVIISPTSINQIVLKGDPVQMDYREGLPCIEQGIPYRVQLPNGKDFHVFPYDYWLSHQLAFGGLLRDPSGEELAKTIDSRFHYGRNCLPAIDGETYGHHIGEGVSALMNYSAKTEAFGHVLTNPGRILAEALEDPARIGTVILHPRSAWSCAHGVGRWSGDCSCEGENPWRAGLRKVFEYLADQFDVYYDRATRDLLRDPAQAKIDYIHVLLGEISFNDFIDQQKKDVEIHPEAMQELSLVFDALYPQQELFLSCGWFFRGISYQTGLNFSAAYDLIRRVKLLDMVKGLELEVQFVQKLSDIANSPGLQQPISAAQAYFWAKSGQEYWYQQFLMQQGAQGDH